MEEKLYDLIVFSDGDARVYDHGMMESAGVYHSAKSSDGQNLDKLVTYNVVQTSSDKRLLIKIAKMARADYVAGWEYGDEVPAFLTNSVDQTGRGFAPRRIK